MSDSKSYDVPKYLFLLSKSVQTLLNFSLTLGVFFILCVLDGIVFSWKFVCLLYPVVMLLFFNLGLGLVLSALYVFFRDMKYLWTVMTQLLMYVSAIFYSVDTFPRYAQYAFMINPVYLFISYFRTIVIDERFPSPGIHLLIAVDALVLLAVGLYVYRKYDTEFLYYV